jgi:NADH:ubiquinone oxidoreductase subunit 2 (subunit N)
MLDKTSLIVVSPEILLLVMACVIAMVDLGVKSRLRTLTYGLTLATLAVVAWFTGRIRASPARPSTPSAAWWSATRWATGSSASPPSP